METVIQVQTDLSEEHCTVIRLLDVLCHAADIVAEVFQSVMTFVSHLCNDHVLSTAFLAILQSHWRRVWGFLSSEGGHLILE